MTTTPNVQAPHVVASQSQKEVTINEATDRLDNAMNAEVELDFTGGDVALTDDDFNANGVFKCVNAGAAQNLDLPARPRKLWVRNASGQTITVRVTGGGGASVAVADGENRTLYSDATDVVDFT